MSQFEQVSPKIDVMSPQRGHPEQTKWILEESSTGFRRNDISNETEPLPSGRGGFISSSIAVTFEIESGIVL